MSIAAVTLIIIGIVVMLYLGIMIIVNHNMSKHDKFIRSMVSIPEILNEYGREEFNRRWLLENQLDYPEEKSREEIIYGIEL